MLKKAFKNEPPPFGEARQHDIEPGTATIANQGLRTAGGVPVIPNSRVMEPHTTKTCSMALGGMPFEASDHFPNDEKWGEGDDADVPDVPGETMKPLRYFLLVATAISFAVLTYNMGEQPRNVPWFIWLFWVGLALNFFYLVFSNSSKPSSGRISRLIRLWLDAKENELRSRAKRNEPH
jgi:hypothetical protein